MAQPASKAPRFDRGPARLRAVITDIDGTITGPDRVLDPTAAALLRHLEGRGIRVIFATGNVLPVALAIHRSLGLKGPIVSENGGLVYRREGRRDRLQRLADRRPAWAAFRAARRAGLPVRRLFTDRWRETEVALEPNVPPAEITRVIRGHDVSVESTGFAIHLMEKGKGKQPALDGVLPSLGLRWTECLAAGDGDNDVGMLRAAGWGVSFPNGSRRARNAADFVSTSSFAFGFVEALKERGAVARRWAP
ncbi:MAG: phosphoglycolate phosphatase [Thermoplasmata archaeon]|nr:phosphoglycolate phosphatase [Thermoplasmata archaeon]